MCVDVMKSDGQGENFIVKKVREERLHHLYGNCTCVHPSPNIVRGVGGLFDCGAHSRTVSSYLDYSKLCV